MLQFLNVKEEPYSAKVSEERREQAIKMFRLSNQMKDWFNSEGEEVQKKSIKI